MLVVLVGLASALPPQRVALLSLVQQLVPSGRFTASPRSALRIDQACRDREEAGSTPLFPRDLMDIDGTWTLAFTSTSARGVLQMVRPSRISNRERRARAHARVCSTHSLVHAGSRAASVGCFARRPRHRTRQLTLRSTRRGATHRRDRSPRRQRGHSRPGAWWRLRSLVGRGADERPRIEGRVNPPRA